MYSTVQTFCCYLAVVHAVHEENETPRRVLVSLRHAGDVLHEDSRELAAQSEVVGCATGLL
jgi:hypothetical protein